MSAIDKAAIRRAAQSASAGTKTAVEPLTRADLREACVLALDPSLTACGLALVEHTERELTVRYWETIRWSEGVDAPETTMAAGDELHRRLTREFEHARFYYPGVEIVLESPPTGNVKGKGRTEPAWTACRTARDVALSLGIPIRAMVPIQRHKKLITGNARADKSEVKLAFGLLAQSLPMTLYPAKTNDNVRDAICVAIADLHRKDDE